MLLVGGGDSNSRSRPPQQANTRLAGDPGRAPEARAFNQARPLPESLVARHGIEPGSPGRAVFASWGGLYRVHRLFRPALYRRVHEPDPSLRSGFRLQAPARPSASLTPAKRLNLVDGARLELALHGCRPWVIPLYEPPNWVSQRERRNSASSWRGRSSLSAEPSYKWGEMRESNSRDRSHNPVPKPFGQSRHRKPGERQ